MLFSPCLLNFGRCTKGVCPNWDNLKWKCLRNDSCHSCPGLCPAAGTEGEWVRKLKGRRPSKCRIWVGAGWSRKGSVFLCNSVNYTETWLWWVVCIRFLKPYYINNLKPVYKPQKDWTDQKNWDDFHLFSLSVIFMYHRKKPVKEKDRGAKWGWEIAESEELRNFELFQPNVYIWQNSERRAEVDLSLSL